MKDNMNPVKRESQVTHQQEIEQLTLLYDKDNDIVGEEPEKQRSFEREFRKAIKK